jgi:hypothetical protein
MALYYTSVPENQSELDDAYWYAYDIEDKLYTEIFHRYHLLYLPTMKLLYEAAHALGLADRSFDFIVVITAISGSLALAACRT